MISTHNLGFPRVGLRRELKFALEAYWAGDIEAGELERRAAALRERHWSLQAGLDQVPVGDFSLYDQVLDMSFTLGHLPPRVAGAGGTALDAYFRLARGRAAGEGEGEGEARKGEGDCHCVAAGEMTKWFDSNYHYIVPEFDRDSRFRLDPERLLAQLAEARAHHASPRPVIIGPVTYLRLGKSRDGSERLDHLPALLEAYRELLATLAGAGCEWLQVDEPVLVTDLEAPWRAAVTEAYRALAGSGPKILLATYFGPLGDNLELACDLPVAGLHLDAVAGREDVAPLVARLPRERVLSLGVIDGRNVWKTDLAAALDWLEPLRDQLGERLWLAPSCSLLHVPVDLALETDLDPELRGWLAFAVQKLEELRVLAAALNRGRESVAAPLGENAAAIRARRASTAVTSPAVREAVAAVDEGLGQRRSPYPRRAALQQQKLKLPAFPTTTIGSFPQTGAIRELRRRWRRGEIDDASYRRDIRAEIADCIRRQEQLGLDVLVHGEAERNDMVEYFGEQLAGFAFTRFGWVQSYGSRCVKPPIIYGDVHRPAPMTVDWIRHAQSLTDRPVKGMLTGPVTILNWSFVRDDQPREATCLQLALAIREEVLDLERAGVSVIQIDEAALRERLPLKRADWDDYLRWSVLAFRVAANGVGDEVQIHTHMCYSEFNDIIEVIAAMDADVITIETSRSDGELLEAFDRFAYPNGIGPGVYDIHSPNRPPVARMVELMEAAMARIPAERLWVNPDCGLKTRRWEEVEPALANMVEAAGVLRSICCAGERHGPEWAAAH